MDKMVLIVDDDVMNIKSIQDILKDDFRIATAVSGPLALRILDRVMPDLILLDVNMPDMNGFEFFEQAKKRFGALTFPVVFMSADRGQDVETRALDAGAEDFIARPFAPALLKARVEHTLERCMYRTRLNEMAQEQAQSLISRTMRASDIQQGMLIAMASLIESRDGSTGEHIKHAERYMEIFSEAVHREGYHRELVTQEYMDNLCKAAYIHDVGKLRVSDAILQKQGGLSSDEFDQIKYHTTAGGEMIRSAMAEIPDEAYLSLAFDVATYHHERWDGSGYPKGLAGEAIPLSARIMAVVDVFDVLSSKRCYKQAIPLPQTFEIMGELAGEQFDPTLAQIFLKHKDEFARLAESFGCAGGQSDE